MLFGLGKIVIGFATVGFLGAGLGGPFIFAAGLVVLFIGVGVANREHVTWTPEVSEGDIERWKVSIQSLRYRYSWKGYGIGVDPDKQVVHLKSFFNDRSVERTYPFSDIREWHYNLQSGGEVFAVGLGPAVVAGMANAQTRAKNERETGFFVAVKDIDYPEWHIRFAPGPNREIEIKRWMEIFRQVVKSN